MDHGTLIPNQITAVWEANFPGPEMELLIVESNAMMGTEMLTSPITVVPMDGSHTVVMESKIQTNSVTLPKLVLVSVQLNVLFSVVTVSSMQENFATTEPWTITTTLAHINAEPTALFLIVGTVFAILTKNATTEYTTTVSLQVLAEPIANFHTVVMQSLTIPWERNVTMEQTTVQDEDACQTANSAVGLVSQLLAPASSVTMDLWTPTQTEPLVVPTVLSKDVVMELLTEPLERSAIHQESDAHPTVHSCVEMEGWMREKIVTMEQLTMTPSPTLVVLLARTSLAMMEFVTTTNNATSEPKTPTVLTLLADPTAFSLAVVMESSTPITKSVMMETTTAEMDAHPLATTSAETDGRTLQLKSATMEYWTDCMLMHADPEASIMEEEIWAAQDPSVEMEFSIVESNATRELTTAAQPIGVVLIVLSRTVVMESQTLTMVNGAIQVSTTMTSRATVLPLAFPTNAEPLFLLLEDFSTSPPSSPIFPLQPSSTTVHGLILLVLREWPITSWLLFNP
jgi:hypothetical protein